jgi:signal transduction histidine kinase
MRSRSPGAGQGLRSTLVQWQGVRSWPIGRVRLEWVDVAWALFSVVNLAAMLVFADWETVPFHFIWISLTLLYGFRVWATRPTMWVLGVVMLTTFAAILFDVTRGSEPIDELNEVPLMAAMFAVMVWHAKRRLAADHERQLITEENVRLLAAQRRFLQDASHQLRTPITIALGHAELLARELVGKPEASDIQVVVGELSRLRRIGEHLLVIAASEDPDFLRPEPIALDRFTMEAIRRWRLAAPRRWRLGRLDEVCVVADRERLGLAVDALLENAVRHTGSRDVIKLSAVSGSTGNAGPEPGSGGDDGDMASLIISDSGGGIPAAELPHIFDRFRSGAGGASGASGASYGGSRGTGLGLALARAIARAHGGDIYVRSSVGAGSEFELMLPAAPASATGSPGRLDGGGVVPGADHDADTLAGAELTAAPAAAPAERLGPAQPTPETQRNKRQRIRQRMRQ